MLVTCFSTARGEMKSRCPIAWLERPSAISSSTSRSRGESSLDGVVAAVAADQLGDDERVERRASLGDAMDRGRELLDVGNAVLEQVPHALCAVGEELDGIGVRDVLGEDEHAGIRVPRADLAGRADPLVRLRGRHADVDDRDVGVVAAYLEHQLVRVSRLPDDLDLGVLEQPREPFAQQGRVVGDHRGEPALVHADVAERRELGVEIVGDELEDPLRLAQPAEVELTELAYRHTETAGRLSRGHDLAAVRCLADVGSTVDVEADEAVAGPFRLAAVQADSHPHALAFRPGARHERTLDLERSGGRGRGLVEDAEELVSTAFDLPAGGPVRRRVAAAHGPRRARLRSRCRGVRRGRWSPRCR